MCQVRCWLTSCSTVDNTLGSIDGRRYRHADAEPGEPTISGGTINNSGTIDVTGDQRDRRRGPRQPSADGRERQHPDAGRHDDKRRRHQFNSGATLRPARSLTLQDGVTLTGGTLDNSGTVFIENSSGATLDGVSIIGSGAIQVDTGPSTLHLADGATMTGGTLTVGPLGTLQVETAGGATLNDVGVTNDNSIEVIGGSILALESGTTVDNASGTVTVDGTATLTLNAATITGGILSNSATVDSTGTSSLHGIAITNALGATLESTGGVLTIDASNTTFDNAGLLQAYGAELDLDNDTLSNGGTLKATGGGILKVISTAITNLFNSAAGTVQADTASEIDLQDSSITGGSVQTIGTGLINSTGISAIDSATIDNAGTFESTGGTLTVDSAVSFTNSGTLQAIDGGTLKLVSTAVTDAATGVTSAGAGSHIDLQDSSLSQHIVSTAVGGVIETVSGSSNTINTANGPDLTGRVNNAGTLGVADNSSLTLISAAFINNTGSIELNSTGNNTTLFIDQPFAGLDGSGNVTLSDDTHNIIAATVSGDQLTNLNNTISGAGDIGAGGLVLVNAKSGVIDANDTSTLKLDPLSLTNSGTLEATNGGTLLISTTTVTNHANLVNGTIAAVGTNAGGTAHSSVGLQDATILGGNISITAQGAVVATGGISTISGAASILNDASTLEANGAELDLVNSIVTNTNSGKLFVTGSGTIKLENATISGGAVDTTGAGDTVEATSGVNAIDNVASISNAGALAANGGTLTIDLAGSFTNTGLVEATDDSLLVLSNLTLTNTDGVAIGTATVMNGSTLDLATATITKGTLTNAGTVDSTGISALTDVGITNTGLIEATIGVLTIDPAVLTNSGTLEANGGELDLTGETVTNTGTLQAINNSTLKLTDTAVNNDDGVHPIGNVTVGDGSTLDLVRATISGGSINDGTAGGTGSIDVTGSSTISSASLNNGAATVESGVKLTLDNVTVTGTDITDKGSIELDDKVTLTEGARIEGTSSLNKGPITNLGMLEVAGAATLLDDVLTNTAQIVQVDDNKTLTLNGSEIIGGTVNDGSLLGTGIIDVTGDSKIDGTSPIHVALNNGAVTVEGGVKLTLDNVTVTRTDITDKGSIELDHNVTLTGGATIEGTSSSSKGPITNLGTLEVAGAATLHDDTLTNTSHVVQVDDGQTLTLSDTTINGGTVATVSAGIIDAASGLNFINGANVVITGILESTGGGTLTIDATSTLADTGLIEANGGNLIVDTGFSGQAKIVGASLLELGANSQTAYSSAHITFADGATGTLELDHAGKFSGNVSGLDDNTIDLADVAISQTPTASYVGTASGGILSIFESGIDVSNINLTGDYLGVRWVLADDGSALHGTDISELPGVITAGLNSHGNASEGSPVVAFVTDGGAVAATATYDWQIFDVSQNKWVDGSGSGVNSATYVPGELDEGHALRVAISFTDALGNSESQYVSAGTVVGTADTPLVSTPNAVATPENIATLLTGLSVSTVDGSANDNADTFTATVYVEQGTLTLGSGLAATIKGGDGHGVADAVLITGSLADVNAALAAVTYTPATEYEGTDTVHFTATSTEELSVGGNTSAAATETTATITVNPVSDTPSVAAAIGSIELKENLSHAIGGVSVTPASGDADDPVTVTLHVVNGTLSLDGTVDSGATVGANGTGTVTVSGLAIDVNIVLATLSYTAGSEFEGSDTLHVTATSKDGAAPASAASAEATVAITVDPVAEAPSAIAPTTLSLNENATKSISGVSVGPLAEDGNDTVSAVLTVGHGKLDISGVDLTFALLSGVAVNGNDSGALTLSGNAAAVNTVLTGLSYTANADYEGSDQLNLSVTSIDGSNTFATPATASTSITVNSVADAPSAVAPATLSLNENATKSISGVSVGPLAEDANDTVSALLTVGHGSLHVGSQFGVTVTGDDSGALTLSGDAAAVNTLLTGLTYTAATEYEGSDTLNVTVTSKDGSNTFATTATASTSITVNPVADQPVITASAAPTVEDATSKLTLTLTNAADLFEDSTDSVTVTVTLGQGAKLSQTGTGAAVTDNHNGTFTLTAHSTTDLNGLTITPAGEFDGTVTVGVSAVTHDGSTAVSVAGTTSTTLTVGPIITASAAAASVNEGGSVGLTISANFESDGDATNVVTVTGVPTTASLSAGTNHGGGSWTLTPAQLSGLKLTAGDDDVSSITLQITASTTEDGHTTSSAPQTVTITENPVADAPTLAGTPSSVSLAKNAGSANFTIADALSETDADSSLGTITISNVPTGVSFNHGAAGSNQTWTLTPADLSGLKINYPNGNQHFTLSVVATSNDGGNIATSAAKSIAVNIAPAGEAGQAINLALADATDGGIGDPITMTVSGVPADWTLNGGTDLGNGTWTVQTNDLSSLTVTTAASFAGAVQLWVTESSTLPDGSISSFSFADNLEAYSAGSPIFALSGDDHLSGAGADDLFVFSQPIGVDIVYNFNAASDKIDLIGFNNVKSFSDIQANLADDAHGNAVITVGAGETITLQGVHAAALNATDFVFDQTPVTTNASNMTIGDGASMPLSGTIDNTGTIALNSTGSETDLQLIEHGATLTGAGQVVLSDSTENVIDGTSPDVTLTNVDNTISGAGQIGAGHLTLTNEGTIDATGASSLTIDTGANAVNNSGTLEATGSGGLVIDSDIVNTGVLWANGGDVTAAGNVSGDGSAMISGAATLEFAHASAENTGFAAGSTGSLALGNSFNFSGIVSGMTASTHIDLLDINFSNGPTLSYIANAQDTGGILSITDGTHTASIAMVGHFDPAGFQEQADKGVGTLITYHEAFHLV